MAATVVTRRGRSTWWAALVAGVVFLAHLPAFTHLLMDGDEAIYGSIAVLMNQGAPLYGSGGVDNKPPGVFWVYAAVFRAFGSYQMTAIHAAGLVAVGLGCVAVFLIARDLAGAGAGILGALFYGLLTAAGNPRLLAANTEVFMMVPLTFSVLLMLRSSWFWSGLLLAAALAFRQSAAADVLLLVPAIAWLAPKERVRAAALVCAGLGAGLLAGGAALAATASLPGFWRWTVGTLYGYASSNWAPALVWSRAKDSVVPFVLDMAVFWIAALAFASRWRTLGVRERLIVVWLAAGMAGSLAGGHLSWHYFIQAMAPLAVLAALAFVRFRVRRAVAVAAAAGIALPAVAWWAFDLTADPLTYDFTGARPQHQAVAAYIAEHTSSSDRIFVWGDWAALYAESGRAPASRFPGFLRGFARGSGAPPDNWDTAPDVWPLLAADLEARPPALIVDTAAAGWSDFASYPMSAYPTLDAIVRARYHAVDTVGGVVLYARNPD